MSVLSSLSEFVNYLSKYELKIKTSDNKNRISWQLFNKNGDCLIKITINVERRILKWIYNQNNDETLIKHIAETSLQYFCSIYYDKDTKITPFPKFNIANDTVSNSEFSYRDVKDKMENRGYRLSSEEWAYNSYIQGNICFFDLSNKIVIQIDYDVNENNLKIVVQDNKTEYITIVILHLLRSYRREHNIIVYYKERDISDILDIDTHKFISFINEHNFHKKEESYDGWRNKIIWEL